VSSLGLAGTTDVVPPRYVTTFQCAGCGAESARSSIGEPAAPVISPCPSCGGERRPVHTTLDRRSRLAQPRVGQAERRTGVG